MTPSYDAAAAHRETVEQLRAEKAELLEALRQIRDFRTSSVERVSSDPDLHTLQCVGILRTIAILAIAKAKGGAS